MSVKLMSLIYETKLGNATIKAVALKLADYANDAGGNIWPALDTVADHTEVSKSTVQRSIRDLLERGILEMESAGGKGAGNTTRYRYNLTKLRDQPKIKEDGQNDQLVKTTSRSTAKNKVVTVTTDPSKEPSRDQRSFESKFDERQTRPAQASHFVSEAALEKVRTIAPGWDRQALLRKYLDWPGSQNARSMDAAFLAWVPKFTKGHKP